MSVVNIQIDGIKIQADSSQTILDAALTHNIYIPTLCHDDRVALYGSCGICVVESESPQGIGRLIRACSTFAAESMVITTVNDRVINTRKAALELLFSNHQGDCRPPCILACPGQTDCQGYIGLIANRQYRQAVELMKEQLPLPSSIGRVCPHPCETACRRKLVEEPVSIAHLKYFASDKFIGDHTCIPDCAGDTGKSVAIIGGGPGGLTAAYFLRQLGHRVSMYDSMPEMGGMLRYGIPEYRLPKNILDKEIAVIAQMGTTFINNTTIGSDLTLDYMHKHFDAVLVAIGAWSSMRMGCPGEDADGVYGGIDFLRDAALNKPVRTGNRVAVVGGGNTAMDACRTAVRLGAQEVFIVYRRTRDEMPAEKIEIDEAEEEGVIFKFLTNPLEIITDNGRVSAIRLQKMQLGDPDESGRRSPVPVEGAEEILAVDSVIMAIGQSARTAGFEALALTSRKTIAADEHTFRTNIDGIFAVGDVTNKGADIAIAAIGEAKRAVDVIDGYLNGRTVQYSPSYLVKSDPAAQAFKDRAAIKRAHMGHLSPEERKSCFKEVNFGFTEDQAVNEAQRCLECGCMDFFECRLIQAAQGYCLDPAKYEGEITAGAVNNDHPFIHRNPEKCILCGLCVRICEELMGITALGLVGRGFDTVVKPAFGENLEENGCISCGQCVTVCPTGALCEKNAVHKQVPLNEDSVNTVCSFCSVGCQVAIMFKGNMIIRCLPDTSIDKQQILCKKGRFGFTELLKAERITVPRINNEQVDVDKACGYINSQLQDIIARHGAQAAAITVSGLLTNEELTLVQHYAHTLGIEVYSFGHTAMCGMDGSTGTFDDLMGADLIVLAVNDIMDSQTIAGIHIRKAQLRGAQIMHITNEAQAEKALEMIKTAQNPVIVLDYTAPRALLTAGLPAKIIELKPMANSQGLTNANVGHADELVEKINHKAIKGLVILGENPDGIDLSAVEFLCVGDAYLTPTAQKADVVLPLAGFAESEGTYTDTVGRIHTLNRAIVPPGGYSSREIIENLLQTAG